MKSKAYDIYISKKTRVPVLNLGNIIVANKTKFVLETVDLLGYDD